jgi:hypothetical protein
MRTLIIHHVESCWNQALISRGTSIEEQIDNLFEHLNEHEYDRVILTRFEGNRLEPEHAFIADFISEVHEYAYGWERDMFTEEQSHMYCDGGTHSEVVMIDDWMHTLSDEVHLCGAFDGECIEDMEIALRFLGVNFKRLEKLIV